MHFSLGFSIPFLLPVPAVISWLLYAYRLKTFSFTIIIRILASSKWLRDIIISIQISTSFIGQENFIPVNRDRLKDIMIYESNERSDRDFNFSLNLVTENSKSKRKRQRNKERQRPAKRPCPRETKGSL